MSLSTQFYLGLALNDIDHDTSEFEAQESGADDVSRWSDAVDAVDRGGFDFVTFGDRFAQPRKDARSPLDAVLLASRLGPNTRQIGVIPSALVSYTEPFHLSTAIATLDYVTEGSAGVQLVVPENEQAAAVFGHTGGAIYGVPWDSRDALYLDAADAAQAVRRLWDSWEDDTIIRDVPTGRFVDREKLHYIDYQGEFFNVKGPSIVPRPPQGQPPVVVHLRDRHDVVWAAAAADIAFVAPPRDDADLAPLLDYIAQAQQRAGREFDPLKVYADVQVALDGSQPTRAAFVNSGPGSSSAVPAVFHYSGSVAELAGRLASWQAQGLDGVRLHPYGLRRDVAVLARELIPLLRQSGLRVGAGAHSAPTLRARLGLPVARNRYGVSSFSHTRAQGVQ